MTQSLHLLLAQQNFCVGDIMGNCEKIIATSHEAKNQFHADLVVFPELALCGYPPEDLLFREDFFIMIDKALTKIKHEVKGIGVLLGFPHKTSEGIFNGALYLSAEGTHQYYHKQKLPNYGVFDEKRYFKPGIETLVVTIKDINVAITLCEDLWFPEATKQAKEKNAELIISLNASPFDIQKADQRITVMRERIKECHIPIIYTHTVGAQDELVFDGASFVMDSKGNVVAQAPHCEECLFPVKVEKHQEGLTLSGNLSPKKTFIENVYKVLTLGLKDYVTKNGFKGALVGLSGGIDSALVLALAVDALGKDNVQAVLMPSEYTSQLSNDLAIELANNLGVHYDILSIEKPFHAFLNTLSPLFKDHPTDITEQNIQARCRGILLMALSNKEGKLLLTTGNKSEMAVGYATLYGDMAGGLAVIKDVYKTLVNDLCRYRNREKEIIPEKIITRAPSAELAHDQKDEDTLPPYSTLDKILECYIENDEGIEQIAARGFDKEIVKKVISMVDRSEYKRRQSPPGLRITTRAFGKERRFPITSRFLKGWVY